MKKSLVYYIGYGLGCVAAICLAAILASLFVVPTIKLVLWLFAFI